MPTVSRTPCASQASTSGGSSVIQYLLSGETQPWNYSSQGGLGPKEEADPGYSRSGWERQEGTCQLVKVASSSENGGKRALGDSRISAAQLHQEAPVLMGNESTQQRLLPRHWK